MPKIIIVASLALTLGIATSCDQGSSPSGPPTTPSGAAPTSSDKKETHPDQPTGQPQSGEGKQIPTTR